MSISMSISISAKADISPGGSSFDPDAQAFITAAAITDATQQSAINTLVTGLKTDGLWTKMKAIYPFVGGTATSHKYNLKDPRDLNAAFRLTFNGGITHSNNGIQGNFTNGYADTNLNARDALIATAMSMGSYIRIAPVSGGVQCDGVRDSTISSWLEIDYTTKNTRNPGQLGVISFVINPLRLCQTVRSSASRLDMYINGVSVGNNKTPSVLINPNYNVFIFARNTNGTASNFGNFQSSFFYVGSSISQADAVTLNTRVQAFQTTLNRQV